MAKTKLSDLIKNVPTLKELWANTTPAADREPIPRGEYVCELTGGELFETKNGTPGYKVTLRVAEGEYAGRLVWHDYYLTEKALNYSLKAFNEIGITDLDQLDDDLPPGLVVKAKIVLKTRDNGDKFNEVGSWKLVSANEVRAPAPTPAAPAPWDVNEDEETPRKGDATLFPTDGSEGGGQ